MVLENRTGGPEASSGAGETVFMDGDFDFAVPENRAAKTGARQRSMTRELLARFFGRPVNSFFAAILALIVIMAVFGPYMNGNAYDKGQIIHQELPPRIPGLEKLGIFDGTVKTGSGTTVDKYADFPDVYYWFGTDVFGRDIFTRTWYGTRISLYIALVAVLVDMVFGLCYGMVSGYFGGALDSAMQRFAEILNGVPTLVTVTLLLVFMRPGLATITFSLMLTGWIGMNRIARAQALKLKEEEFVLSARTLGASSARLITRQILPNTMGVLITNTMFSIPNAIFTEAFLAFIGLGVPLPMASLGSMIGDGYDHVTTASFMIVPPVVVLVLIMVSFNVLADGLRDALDPKMLETR